MNETIREPQSFVTSTRVMVWIFAGVPATTLLFLTIYFITTLFWEYLHNSHRHFYEVAVMAPLLSLTSTVVASIAQIIIYLAFPWCALVLLRRINRVPLVVLLLLTPVLGLLAWFGYDYLVPDFRWHTDSDSHYQHGLTLSRFLKGWGLEALVVVGFWLGLRLLSPRIASLR